MIRLKKSRKKEIPWILHGYNGNQEMTKQLIQHGFYFSYGLSIFKFGENQLRAIESIPLEKLFFENDVSNHPIETIYKFAAPLLQLSTAELKKAVFRNYKRLLQHG